jgi:hypothetical protein
MLTGRRDVYWSSEGRVSVDVALTTSVIATIYFRAKAFWRRLGRESALSLREHLSERLRG